MPSDPPPVTEIDTDEFDEAFNRQDEPKKSKAPPKSKANGADAGTGHGDRWLDACQTDSRSEPRNNVHNALLALRNDPAWAGELAFDEMLRVSVLCASGVAIEDPDVFRVHAWMQAHGLERMGIENVREAVEIVAREKRFHPLLAQLEALVWDGVNRQADWLVRYLGTPDDEYHKAVGSMFLTAMVRRIYQPGCQADYMLVLVGEQGEAKSQVCRTLATAQYFSSNLPPLSSDPVRVSMHLRGKWIIEVAELAALISTRVGNEHVKAFITNQVEQYTPKHARKEVQEPRSCLFIGTTNDEQCLKDDTGNRRFWPVRCGIIDLDALRRDRDQLIAEAVQSHLNGAQHWPDRDFEKTFIEPVQDAHLWVDAWQQPVERFLAAKIKDAYAAAAGPPRVTVAEIARQSDLDIPDGKLDPILQKRIIAALRHANWTLSRTGKVRFWKPR